MTYCENVTCSKGEASGYEWSRDIPVDVIIIFKGQLSILLRLTEFVLNRKLSKSSSKVCAEIFPCAVQDSFEGATLLNLRRIPGASVMCRAWHNLVHTLTGYEPFAFTSPKAMSGQDACGPDSELHPTATTIIIPFKGSPLSLPSRSDTRYTECLDIVNIHIQSVLRLIHSSDL